MKLTYHLMTSDVLGAANEAAAVKVRETPLRFLPGEPEGRPELYAERFDRTTAGAAGRGQS